MSSSRHTQHSSPVAAPDAAAAAAGGSSRASIAGECSKAARGRHSLHRLRRCQLLAHGKLDSSVAHVIVTLPPSALDDEETAAAKEEMKVEEQLKQSFRSIIGSQLIYACKNVQSIIFKRLAERFPITSQICCLIVWKLLRSPWELGELPDRQCGPERPHCGLMQSSKGRPCRATRRSRHCRRRFDAPPFDPPTPNTGSPPRCKGSSPPVSSC
jgi:hypothetical protein